MQQTLMCVCCMYSTIDPDRHQLLSILVMYLKILFYLPQVLAREFFNILYLNIFVSGSIMSFWSTSFVGLIQWVVTLSNSKFMNQ